jgi:hypothetical protein
MKKLLTIVPSRGRNLQHIDFVANFQKKSKISDLLIGLDDDDEANYQRQPNVIYEVNPRLRLIATSNILANKYVDQYEYFGFMGDDHRPRTDAWDELLINSIKDKKYGIAYGEDLIKSFNLPTAVVLKTEIVKVLGYIGPPTQIHLCIDIFWKNLGKALGTLTWNSDVIIEHIHPIRKKAPMDQTYHDAYQLQKQDLKNFAKYMKKQFPSELAKFN